MNLFEVGQRTPTPNILAALRRAIEAEGIRLLLDETSGSMTTSPWGDMGGRIYGGGRASRAGGNRVGIFVPVRDDLFYDHATDPIGCVERGQKGWILAAFQSSDVLGGAASWVWHLIVASCPQHSTMSRRISARPALARKVSDCAIPVSSIAVITNRPLPAVQ